MISDLEFCPLGYSLTKDLFVFHFTYPPCWGSIAIGELTSGTLYNEVDSSYQTHTTALLSFSFKLGLSHLWDFHKGNKYFGRARRAAFGNTFSFFPYYLWILNGTQSLEAMFLKSDPKVLFHRAIKWFQEKLESWKLK